MYVRQAVIIVVDQMFHSFDYFIMKLLKNIKQRLPMCAHTHGQNTKKNAKAGHHIF